jgi:hypothetical protein
VIRWIVSKPDIQGRSHHETAIITAQGEGIVEQRQRPTQRPTRASPPGDEDTDAGHGERGARDQLNAQHDIGHLGFSG